MNILIADKFPKHAIDALQDMRYQVVVDPGLKGDTLREAIKQTACEVLVVRSTHVTAEMMADAPKLAMIIRAGSGFDTIDVAAARDRGITVCNCPGKNAVAVAELTIGLMIALDRRIVEETEDLRRHTWNKPEYSKARGLKGRTLGIVGLGRVGYEVAQRAVAFDMEVIYSDIRTQEEIERKLGICHVSFDEILERADFITLHVPGGADTRHLIGRNEFARMKPAAFVINCSRGGVVDEQALAQAVREGQIAGAALDVYEIEPAATDSEFKDPITELPRVYGTHHVGASTEQAQDAVADEVVKIIRTYADTGKFINCVSLPKEATTA